MKFEIVHTSENPWVNFKCEPFIYNSRVMINCSLPWFYYLFYTFLYFNYGEIYCESETLFDLRWPNNKIGVF